MSELLSLDTADDRREIWSALHRLPPADRVNFLRFACTMVPPGAVRLPEPVVGHMKTTLGLAYRCDRADARLTNEVYCDLLSLLNDFHVSAAALTTELVMWVRSPDHRRAAVRSLAASSRGSRPAPAPGSTSGTSCTGA